MLKTAFSVCFSFTLVNFAWQLAGNHNWLEAMERSFFQIAAVITYYFLIKRRCSCKEKE